MRHNTTIYSLQLFHNEAVDHIQKSRDVKFRGCINSSANEVIRLGVNHQYENLYSPHMVVEYNKNSNGTKTKE